MLDRSDSGETLIFQINTTCNQRSITYFIRAASAWLAFRTLGDHIRGFYTIGDWTTVAESQIPAGAITIDGRTR